MLPFIHTSNETKAWLQKAQIKTYPHPPNSPDLNPIEDIWGIIKQKLTLSNKRFIKVNDLIAEVTQIWEESITAQLVNSCID